MSKKKYYQRPDGLFETIRVIDGHRKAFRGRTEREVDRKILEYKGAVERGRPFREVADEWEAEHFRSLAPNTLKGYSAALKRAVEYFGDTPIKQIKAPDIKKFITEFSRTGPGQTPRAQKTVTNQRLVVNLIMEHAAENGELEYNPCAHVSIPKGLPKTHRDPATTSDEEKIRKATDIWLFPFLLLYTGLRRGEALGLTYDDIDRKNKVIHVRRSVYYVGRKPKLKLPKTEAGLRTVPILDPLLPLLPKKPRGGGARFIFSTNGGKTPLTETEYANLWEEFKAATGVTCTAHQLRHSYATMLFDFDVSLKDAQDLLGHSTAAMTQDIYTHIRDKHRQDTAQLINAKLRKK